LYLTTKFPCAILRLSIKALTRSKSPMSYHLEKEIGPGLPAVW